MRQQTLARLQVLAAALLFSGGGAGIKACALSSYQVASFRSGVAALAVWILVREARTPPGPRALLVGSAYAATLVLFVLANKLTTAANTIFLQSTAPLYIVLLGPWLLGERIRKGDLGLLALALAGLAMFFVGIEPPRSTAPDPARGNLLALLAGATWALTLMGLRWMSRGGRGGASSPAAAVLAGNVIAFLAVLPPALPVGPARPADWAIIAGLGLLQIGLAYRFLTAAFRHVPALEASLLLLLEPVLNPVWAWIVQGERPQPWSLLGGLLILTAATSKTALDLRD
ncbi:MAG TPA: DMT family transporter [Candidatus Eisenbacteria bacterium]